MSKYINTFEYPDFEDAKLNRVFQSIEDQFKKISHLPPLPWVDVRTYGAKLDGIKVDAFLVQQAINEAQHGSTIYIPGKLNLGDTQLNLRSSLKYIGGTPSPENEAPFSGTLVKYQGIGNAFKAQNVKNIEIVGFHIDLTGATGTPNGIYLNGAWLTTLKNIRIQNILAGGNSILLDTNAGFWGAQHNYFERIEAADAPIKLIGTSGSDQVTTTVLNVIRGKSYIVDYASSVTFIDSTAEAFSDKGFDLINSDQINFLGVDIEGAGTTGIAFGTVKNFIGIGVNFNGFVGTNAFTGAPQAGCLLTSGVGQYFWGELGSLIMTRTCIYNVSSGQFTEIGATNSDAVDNTKAYKYRLIVEGDGTNQKLIIRAYRQGSPVTTYDTFAIINNQVYIDDEGTLKPISFGANDSGGTGYKLLRIGN